MEQARPHVLPIPLTVGVKPDAMRAKGRNSINCFPWLVLKKFL